MIDIGRTAPTSGWSPYCGVAPSPADLIARWNLDPVLLVVLGLSLAALIRLGSRTGRPFAIAAVLVLAVSFISPLCALGSALFSARTVHHVLLVAVAAPLLAWSLPMRRVGPLAAATLVQGAVFWGWHAPGAYAAALSNNAVYWLMQFSLLGSATWFWMGLRTASTPGAVAALLIATVQMGLLGALITFAEAPLYAPHLLTTQAFQLSPLDDQQMAGLIMWAPAALVYLIGALVVLGRRIGPDRPVEARRA